MTYEFKHIINQAYDNQKKGLRSVLATVVDLEGSSYRKPGVRMLISENGTMVGAISGGCVEKEVMRRAQSIFKDGKSKVITYDGRYRLGCEGVLYILLEPFFISDKFAAVFSSEITHRNPFTIKSYYLKQDEVYGGFGSEILFNHNSSFTFSDDFNPIELKNVSVFSQQLQPVFKLTIIGAEHDAVKLCQQASFLGWEVDVLCSAKDPKSTNDFTGCSKVIPSMPETFCSDFIEENSAVVLMNHSYVQDLQYLLKLKDRKLCYLGMLGAVKRRDRMFSEIFEINPEISEDFLESIHTPAGLNIGAKTPEEIALSILAEIMTVVKQRQPFSLKSISGKIHT